MEQDRERGSRGLPAAFPGGAVGAVLGLIGLGTAIRIVLAATTDGNTFDLESFQVVRELLAAGDFAAIYGPATFVEFLDGNRWPYPPGYFPFIAGSGWLEGVTGIEFKTLVRFPSVVADAAIAWLVFVALRPGGDGRAIVGAGAVALGPSFIAVSGHHGQIDALAVLPAVLAVILWQRPGLRRRALVCGLLIGCGAAIKSPVGLLVLALLPTSRSLRESGVAVASAAAVPLALLAPFLIDDFGRVVDAMSYRGLPGIGGISLLVQPDLAAGWLGAGSLEYSSATDFTQRLNGVLVALGVLGAAAVMAHRRCPPAVAASAIVLAIWVFGINFSLTWVVWGIPFFLIAGYLRAAIGLQVLLLAPTLIVYLIRTVDGWDEWVAYGVFVPAMLAALAGWTIALARLLRGPGAIEAGGLPERPGVTAA